MTGSIVIAGASLAGFHAARALRRGGFEGELTLIGEEQHRPYNRPPLSKGLLAGTSEPEGAALRGDDLGATWLLGRRASALDLSRRVVTLSDGAPVTFDRLVIATGAEPRRLRMAEIGGVFALRTLDDCLALRSALTRGRPRVVIVGAGFIGCEVASTCRALGLEVDVVEPLPFALAPLGPAIGGIAIELQRESGVAVHLGRSVTGVEGNGRLERVRLDDGSVIAADVAVVGIGAVPATGWLEGSGLVLDDGVVCDATSAAVGCTGVVAAGDVARWPNPLFGGYATRLEHWSNAADQGAAAAATLLAPAGERTPYAPVPYFWTDQFGVKIQSLGHPELADESALAEGSVEERRFTVLYGRAGRVVGAVAFNLPARMATLRALIAERAPFAPLAPTNTRTHDWSVRSC